MDRRGALALAQPWARSLCCWPILSMTLSGNTRTEHCSKRQSETREWRIDSSRENSWRALKKEVRKPYSEYRRGGLRVAVRAWQCAASHSQLGNRRRWTWLDSPARVPCLTEPAGIGRQSAARIERTELASNIVRLTGWLPARRPIDALLPLLKTGEAT